MTNKLFGVQTPAQFTPKKHHVLRTILLTIGGLAFIALAYVVYIGWSIFSAFGSAVDDVTHKQDMVKQAYSSIRLPDGIELRNATTFGDALDSPDHVGWQYNYRLTAKSSATQVYTSFQDNLKAANYSLTHVSASSASTTSQTQDQSIVVSQDPSSSQNQTAETSASYEIEALSSDGHVSIGVGISEDKYIIVTAEAK